MTPPDFKDLKEASRWATDHEHRHAREGAEQREEFGRMLEGATKHIDGVAKKLTDDGAERTKKLEAIEKGQKRTNRYLRASAEERGRRIQREADEAARFKWARYFVLPIAIALLALYEHCK